MPSIILLHPCNLAKILPLTKPYKAGDVQAALEHLEDYILEGTAKTVAEVLPAIHTITKKIVVFCEMCGTSTLHRTPIIPILDVDLISSIQEALIPADLEGLFFPPTPINGLWNLDDSIAPLPTPVPIPDARPVNQNIIPDGNVRSPLAPPYAEGAAVRPDNAQAILEDTHRHQTIRLLRAYRSIQNGIFPSSKPQHIQCRKTSHHRSHLRT